MCTIFDLLGVLHPWILELKLIVQKLWRWKIELDSIIPKDLLDRFKKFQNGFIFLGNIEISCYYGFGSSTETIELLILADSSNQAYGAVAYIRDVKKDRVNISFVLGKSKFASLDENALTSPKLELSAAVVAARMKVQLLEESNISINKVYFWVDSKTVLHYIGNENKRFSVFVSHRVNEIRNNSNIADWHFIEGKLNVADDCSPMIKCKDFTSNSRYPKGPELLREFSLKEVLQTDGFLRKNEPSIPT